VAYLFQNQYGNSSQPFWLGYENCWAFGPKNAEVRNFKRIASSYQGL
jgi:hypothetical protein